MGGRTCPDMANRAGKRGIQNPYERRSNRSLDRLVNFGNDSSKFWRSKWLGRPLPGGFCKARRLLERAERWKVPVFSVVDTSGAYSGIESEASACASEISHILTGMNSGKMPTIALVVIEGGSGLALSLALADSVLILRRASSSVISPKGVATFLYSDANRVPELAEFLHIAAPELFERVIADQIAAEPEG